MKELLGANKYLDLDARGHQREDPAQVTEESPGKITEANIKINERKALI